MNSHQNSELRTQKPEVAHSPRAAFTLVELLAVMAVIALLVGILYPTLRSIRDGAKKSQAKSDVQKLETAFQQYYNEYGKWPDTTGRTWNDYTSMLNGNRKPYDGGAATAWATANNPRGIKFMDFEKKQIDPANGNFLDPWGTPYNFVIDNGQTPIPNIASWQDTFSSDGLTETPSSPGPAKFVPKPYFIYSYGPNKINDGGRAPQWDDVTNWY